MKKRLPMICALLMVWSVFACVSARHEVDIRPVEIKPIHITIDVNVKVDRALDDFFGDIDEAAEEIKSTD